MFLGNLVKYLVRKIDNQPIYLRNLQNVSGEHNFDGRPDLGNGKVSIIIPTRDKPSLLRSCIGSITSNTYYRNFEIIVVNNGSVEKETLELLVALKNEGVKVLDYPQKFNFSAICDFAVSRASGEYLCFLNNDTEVLQPEWLGSMVDHAKVSDVGLVGAILTYPDNTLQHVGISLQHSGIASHPYRGLDRESLSTDECFQVSGVTFACAVISKIKFEMLGGLDTKFPVGFNDVDFSIRSLRQGMRNVVCVKSQLLHSESKSRSRTQSPKGFLQGALDVFRIIKKHPKPPRELFFSR